MSIDLNQGFITESEEGDASLQQERLVEADIERQNILNDLGADYDLPQQEIDLITILGKADDGYEDAIDIAVLLNAIQQGSTEIEGLVEEAISGITANIAKDKIKGRKQLIYLDEVVSILQATIQQRESINLRVNMAEMQNRLNKVVRSSDKVLHDVFKNPAMNNSLNKMLIDAAREYSRILQAQKVSQPLNLNIIAQREASKNAILNNLKHIFELTKNIHNSVKNLPQADAANLQAGLRKQVEYIKEIAANSRVLSSVESIRLTAQNIAALEKSVKETSSITQNLKASQEAAEIIRVNEARQYSVQEMKAILVRQFAQNQIINTTQALNQAAIQSPNATRAEITQQVKQEAKLQELQQQLKAETDKIIKHDFKQTPPELKTQAKPEPIKTDAEKPEKVKPQNEKPAAEPEEIKLDKDKDNLKPDKDLKKKIIEHDFRSVPPTEPEHIHDGYCCGGAISAGHVPGDGCCPEVAHKCTPGDGCETNPFDVQKISAKEIGFDKNAHKNASYHDYEAQGSKQNGKAA